MFICQQLNIYTLGEILNSFTKVSDMFTNVSQQGLFYLFQASIFNASYRVACGALGQAEGSGHY